MDPQSLLLQLNDDRGPFSGGISFDTWREYKDSLPSQQQESIKNCLYFIFDLAYPHLWARVSKIGAAIGFRFRQSIQIKLPTLGLPGGETARRMVRESGSRFPRVPRISAGRETKGVTTAVTGCVGSSFGAQARDRSRSGRS